MRARARVFEVDPHTGLPGLVEAAAHRRALSCYFLCDVPVTQVQLDERSARLRAGKEGEVSEAEALTRLSRSPRWGWVAMAPGTKWVLALDVGARTLARAPGVGPQVLQGLASGGVPRCLPDGFKAYATALLTPSGQGVQPARRQATGPAPKPRWRPLPELLDAQVVKSSRRRRIVGGQHRVGFGTMERGKQVLAAWGQQIKTAFVERLNLDIHQRVAAVGRRGNTRCQGEDGLQHHLAVCQTSHHCVLPHASLRQPLPQLWPTNGTGSAKRGRPCTPAMAAGLTDQVWTLREVLLFRVPPWPQPAGV
jgi:hypothetical protein